MRGLAIAVAAAGLSLGVASSPALAAGGAPEDDAYVRGYVSAVAEREFGVRPSDVHVSGGVVRVNAPQLSADQRARLADSLRTIRGVSEVQVVTAPAAPAAVAATDKPAVATSPAPHATPTASDAAPVAVPAAPVKTADRTVDVPATDDTYRLGLLPGKTLFDPLFADPRWPDISGTYRAYQNSRKFDNTGAANFGGSLAIVRFEGPGDRGLSELGLQAGVFSTFDLDAESHDLINADYFVSLYDTYRIDKFSIMGRILHQSSHLGDEYLIKHLNDPGFQRVNLSYEQLNLIGSYDLTPSWRAYVGGGFLIDTDPEDLNEWSVQYGVEYKAPWKIGDHLRPVAAADFQQKGYESWDLDLSVRAGVQIEGAELRGNRLMLLLEYYTGHDPNGQFYKDYVDWYGVGLHWFF